MSIGRIKNWNEFQHYKDRSPPWIKLHRKLLDDRAFIRLPLASRAIAPMIWLLASEHENGQFDADPENVSFRLRLSIDEVTDGLKGLIAAGFVILDSDLLAGRLQPAAPEREAETESESASRDKSLSADVRNARKRRSEPVDESPIVVQLPLNDGSEYPITADQVREFTDLYPAVDVTQALRSMRGWCVTNPTNRKTRAGILRFVNRWLAKEQDSARPANGGSHGNSTSRRGLSAVERVEAAVNERRQREFGSPIEGEVVTVTAR